MKLTVKKLRLLGLLTIGNSSYKMNKSELIEGILEEQYKNNPILIKDDQGVKYNPEVRIYDYDGWEKIVTAL
ncbi:hypothetical protein V7128_01995 [Neobacillus vireti]|uniref:hypothetical protein n=1 Tax=Neobacillus vireti TaxID=220686 RepID=UPI002FFEE1E5